MSARELKRSTSSANESNIPILKKTFAKKSKGCSKLPELQKYIETIIKASNEFDSENTSLSDKEKFPKGRQFGRHVVCKGLESKIKHEKLKFDAMSNKRKNKRQTSKSYSEAVSRGVEVLHKFLSEFEDPRNWTIRNSDSHLKIEKLIEKFYPNPYTICCENSDTHIIFEKTDSGDETLYDVLISKVDAETQDDLDKTNLVTADFQVILSEREDKSTSADLALSFENLHRSLPNNKSKESKVSDFSKLSTISNASYKSSSVRHSVSVSNASSRISSIESISQVLRKESQTNYAKKQVTKPIALRRSGEILPRVNKPNCSDYDLGKLKLLNLSDSDGSTSKIFPTEDAEMKNKNNIASDDYVNEISSEICNEISKTNDLNDLLQIYEVMNKATESFLYLTSIKKPAPEGIKQAEVPEDTPTEITDTQKDLDIATESSENKNLNDIAETPVENIKKEEETADKATKSESEIDTVSSPIDSERKFDDEIFDANQKIHEVLDFMNDCFLRFANEGKNQEEKTPEESKPENATNDSTEDKEQKILTTFQQSTSDLRNETKSPQTGLASGEVENTQPTVLERATKSQNIRIRVKRKSKIPTSNLQEVYKNTAVNVNEPSTSDIPTTESAVVPNENVPIVAEGQNELGAYTEEPQESTEDSRVSKSVLPLSNKIRRTQPETYKTLKDALETEEKLLKLNKPESKKLISCTPESQIVMQNDSISGYPSITNFDSVNSSFVLCFTPAVVSPNLPLPKPLSLSLIDFRSWNLKPLSEPVKECTVEKLSLPQETEHRVSILRYSVGQEMVLTVNNTTVNYCASPVGFTTELNTPRIQKEYSLEYSTQQIRVKPLKKFSIVNLNAPGTSGFCIKNTVTFTTSKSNMQNDSDSGTSEKANDKSMEALIRAIQETENVFLLQQQNNSGNNFEAICSCRSNKDGSDNEVEKENDKRKVQDLLLRTYKLQKKLQQYLCNISHAQPTLCSLLKRAREKSPTPEDSVTNISAKSLTLEPPSDDKNKRVDEDVQKVDQSTDYFPPREETPTAEDFVEKNEDKEEETPLNLENDDDDRSSTYSFKSSNDYSETNEAQNLQEQEPSGPGDAIKRIFSQIELLKQSVDGEALKRQEKKFADKTRDNNKLVELDPKNPAKVLKTVFKGRKSSTELTIGLKDVPMTKVSNISVEKTKFSPNHTKISICISKETPSKISTSDNSDSKVLSNKVSSYFFDHMRPSLSMCQTEYSKIEDNISKSSQSLNEGTDDEDDFKSVASTFDSNSSTDKPKNQEIAKTNPSKSYTKHKFDFYRKMDMNVEGLRVRQRPASNSLLRFKELEPLKQALTELQIRMRSIRREAILNSNDYYERALKLAKMSAGYCQSCGTRAVIPDDTFGYYKNLLPRRHAQNRRNRHLKTAITPNSSFYSFRSSNAEVSGQFCDLDIKGGSSFSLNRTTHSNRTVLRSSLQDMPIVFEKM